MSGVAMERHDSPLRETLSLIDREKYYFDLELGLSGAGRETVDSLLSDGGDGIARRMELARSQWGLSDRDAALSVVGAYAWGVGGPAIACYVLSRRVPDISPSNVAVRLGSDEEIFEAGLLRATFAVLPADPATDHPATVVLDSERKLLGWMRDRLVAGLEPLIESVREHVRLGQRAAWRNVSDFVAEAFLMVGWDAEDQASHAADAEAFLTAPGSPLKGNTRSFVVEERGRRAAYVTRGVCCQAYKDPEEDNCDSCPMLTQGERERRALADLAARG